MSPSPRGFSGVREEVEEIVWRANAEVDIERQLRGGASAVTTISRLIDDQAHGLVRRLRQSQSVAIHSGRPADSGYHWSATFAPADEPCDSDVYQGRCNHHPDMARDKLCRECVDSTPGGLRRVASSPATSCNKLWSRRPDAREFATSCCNVGGERPAGRSTVASPRRGDWAL